jgi:integrase/recombinase XerD
MNKTSVYLRVRDRPRLDGSSALYLSITVNGILAKVNLSIYWPATLVDKMANNLKPKKKSDKECSDYNLIIGTEIGKLNEIFVRYRLNNIVLSVDQCIKEYRNFGNRNSFIDFMEKSIKEKYKAKILGYGSQKSNKITLGWLKLFNPKLAFIDLTPKNIEAFDLFLKTKKSPYTNTLLSRNTISSINKTFR